LLPGCWAYVGGPAASELKSERRQPAATLIVDETAFPWGNGRLGASLAQDLIENRAFERVAYALIPKARPDVEIRVVARASVDEYENWGMVASLVTAVFVLLPLPVMPYFDDWQLSADVRIELRDRGVLQVPVQEKIRVTHAFFALQSRYQGKVQEIFVRRIREEIVRALQESAPQARFAAQRSRG
jgi:hypothetical protein